jgi:hypothetical protein
MPLIHIQSMAEPQSPSAPLSGSSVLPRNASTPEVEAVPDDWSWADASARGNGSASAALPHCSRFTEPTPRPS